MLDEKIRRLEKIPHLPRPVLTDNTADFCIIPGFVAN